MGKSSRRFRKAQEGDQKALTYYYNRVKDNLKIYCRKKIANQEDAEDIFMEIILKFIVKFHDIKSEDVLYGFLYKSIAHNKIVDYYRKKKPDVIDADTSDPEIRDLIESDYDQPDDMLIKAQEMEMVHTAVDHLPVKDAEVMRLRFFAELEIPQICERLGKSDASVKNRITRAKRRMRKYINRHYPDYKSPAILEKKNDNQ